MFGQNHVPIPSEVEFEEDLVEPPPVDKDPVPEDEEGERLTRVQEYVRHISQPVKTKTIILCEPVPSRKQTDMKLAAMRLYIRLTNAGCPVHRVHTDRARELMSTQLQAWFTERAVALTATIGEEPASNGRAEVGIQVVKSQIRG